MPDINNESIEKIRDNYLLRMLSFSFLMLVDKNTGEYVNLYKTFSMNDLKNIESTFDKHINMI